MTWAFQWRRLAWVVLCAGLLTASGAMASGRVMPVVVAYRSSAPSTKGVAEKLRRSLLAARTQRGYAKDRVPIVSLDIDSPRARTLAASVGIGRKDLPCLVVASIIGANEPWRAVWQRSRIAASETDGVVSIAMACVDSTLGRSPVKVTPPTPLFSAPVRLNFDTVDASRSDVSAEAYLKSRLVGVVDVTPGTRVVISDARRIYEGAATVASSPPNVLTQVGSNDPVGFSLLVGFVGGPVDEVRFTRPRLKAGPNGIIHPQWKATAYDARGNRLSTVSEDVIRSYSDVPAREFTLTGTGIYKVRFESDNGHFAAFSAVLIDDVILIPHRR